MLIVDPVFEFIGCNSKLTLNMFQSIFLVHSHVNLGAFFKKRICPQKVQLLSRQVIKSFLFFFLLRFACGAVLTLGLGIETVLSGGSSLPPLFMCEKKKQHLSLKRA